MIRIGALISGGGTNLQAILDSCGDRSISGEVVFVGTDNPDATGLRRAAERGIPTFVVDYGRLIRQYREDPAKCPLPPDADMETLLVDQRLLPADSPATRRRQFIASRVIAEAALLAAISSHRFDVLVLAGFMRALTPYFIDRVNPSADAPRIMNIHPALLPAFPGVDGYGDTFRYGCKVGGCTVHFVDYGEDTGPIIGQRAFAIAPGDTLDTIREKGLRQEWRLYPECIQLFAQDRLRIRTIAGGRRIVDILPAQT
ncbi:MAG: phosphoribosylglycinamide formyltransferase [Pseudomonadota bacterium]